MLNRFRNKLVKSNSEYVLFLNNYFAGKVVKNLKRIILDRTPFQKKVLAEVCKIPYGETRSYSQIARAIGKPKVVRAVASAIARNTLLIVIPCHRVIKSDGSTGKYRAGARMKKLLLEFERINLSNK